MNQKFLQHDETTLQQLELPKILSKLGEFLVTPYGREHLKQLSPNLNPEFVNKRLSEVVEMIELLNSGYAVPLGGMEEIRGILEKCKPENAFLDPPELLQIKGHLQMMMEISGFFQDNRQIAPILNEYARGIHTHRNIIKEIEYTIEPGGEVRDNATPELRKIRIQIRHLENEQKKVLQQVIKKYTEFSQDDITTLRDGRMVLGIQQHYAHKVNGIVHGTSSTGATIFIEPMETLKISNEVQNLRIQEGTEIIKILRMLTDLIRQVRLDILFGIENIGALDLIYAKARMGMALNANIPKVISEPRIKIIAGKHPLLIFKIGFEPVIPVNLEMGDNFTTLVITGPNAGGKTVALKTMGLLILMVQYGLPVPADPGSEIPLLSQILVDIGDRQSIEQDLSTFSGHILRLQEILEKADGESLILIDEIGTGTDPREGSALSIAILSRLTHQGVLTVATTHHGELKAFAHATDKVENASMEFDLKTLQPTYRLRVGIPGSSYAFEIARRYGLSSEIIEAAREITGREKSGLEDLILQLEERLQILDKERRELTIKLSEAEGLRNLYKMQVEQLKKEKKELKRKAAEEAQNILRESKKTVENLVAEIRTTGASSESIKMARQTLRQKEKEMQKILEPEKKKRTLPDKLEKGDRVWIESLREEGELLEAPENKDKIRVLVGNIKMTLEISGLQKITKPSGEGGYEVHSTDGTRLDSAKEGIKPELDLRGLDVEQAIEETDRYLHQALEAGWEELRIIHGKGSGILRQRINEYLSRDKRVSEKRLGRWGEGDTGVTIVRLNKESG